MKKNFIPVLLSVSCTTSAFADDYEPLELIF